MAAAGKWKSYDLFKRELGLADFDLTAGTFKCALYLSASNANTLGGGLKAKADLTSEHANANGYTTGGNTLTSVTWTDVTGTETFTSANTVWTAAGGSIIARFAVVYKSGTFGGIIDPIMFVSLLDTAPADVTATDTNTLTIQINASGIATLSGATVD